MDLSSIKGVRFSISKDLWHERDFYNTLPDRVYGTFDQWLTIASRTPKITWDDGQTDTRLTLEQILPPEYSMKLEEYADGRRPPRPKGQPRQHPQPASDADAITIDIEYKRGARNLTQTWVYAEPDSIDVDERTQERFRPKINREADQYSSPYRFVQNVALPMKLIKKMFGESGWINQRLSGEDNTYQNRKTTVGEGIQYISYMIAIANNPGQPVREMWAEKTKPGVKTVLPPPGIGRFGMAENRFLRLTQLVPLCYSVSEAELDQSDPWRYVNPFIDGFNDHWKEMHLRAQLALGAGRADVAMDGARGRRHPEGHPLLVVRAAQAGAKGRRAQVRLRRRVGRHDARRAGAEVQAQARRAAGPAAVHR
tara:strand:+ start:609 stop:1712 length:1104 start_codon:yes stop_codon:yes gene_type:complete